MESDRTFRSVNSRYRFFLPTRLPISEGVEGFDFRLYGNSPEKSLGHLCWHCLFSRKFKTTEWYVLYFIFTKQFGRLNRIQKLLLYGCLRNSVQRKLTLSWDVNHIPLKSVFNDFKVTKFGNFKYSNDTTLLSLLTKELRIPNKALPLDEIRSFDIIFKRYRKPISPNFIGVGYKDKGSLNTGDGYEPEIPDFDPAASVDLWEQCSKDWWCFKFDNKIELLR